MLIGLYVSPLFISVISIKVFPPHVQKLHPKSILVKEGETKYNEFTNGILNKIFIITLMSSLHLIVVLNLHNLLGDSYGKIHNPLLV